MAFSPFRVQWAIEPSRWPQDGPREPQDSPQRGHLGAILGHLGAILGPFEAILGLYWAALGHLIFYSLLTIGCLCWGFCLLACAAFFAPRKAYQQNGLNAKLHRRTMVFDSFFVLEALIPLSPPTFGLRGGPGEGDKGGGKLPPRG